MRPGFPGRQQPLPGIVLGREATHELAPKPARVHLMVLFLQLPAEGVQTASFSTLSHWREAHCHEPKAACEGVHTVAIYNIQLFGGRLTAESLPRQCC